MSDSKKLQLQNSKQIRRGIRTTPMEARFNSSTRHHRYSLGTLARGLILPKASSLLPPSSAADTTPSSSSVDLQLFSLTSQSYTSLKDVLPAMPAVINSPTTPSYDIPIRNRLVKQAAWAYLQPAPASPSSSTAPFFQCLPVGDYHFLLTPINAFFSLFNCGLLSALARAFRQLLIHLGIRTSSSNQ